MNWSKGDRVVVWAGKYYGRTGIVLELVRRGLVRIRLDDPWNVDVTVRRTSLRTEAPSAW
jgi:ribosomal protein L24